MDFFNYDFETKHNNINNTNYLEINEINIKSLFDIHNVLFFTF